MPNPFVHVELNSTDVDKSKEFYMQLFPDWELQDAKGAGGIDYTMIATGNGGAGGGMMHQMMPGAPSFWLPYAEVSDIRESTLQARELGATVVKEVTPVENMGWLSIITDPTGAMIGLWQSI